MHGKGTIDTQIIQVNLPEHFNAYNQKNGLLHEDDHIIVGVSGGPDSMALLHLLRRLGFVVAAAHCNYQLRGKASNEDEQLVKSYCTELQVPFYSTTVDLAAQLQEDKAALQEKARQIRYAFFNELLDEGYNKIATAHHANDNAETVLLNLIRGAGLKGLSGIPNRNKEIVRPLLFATKGDILEYIHVFDIPFREDASNLKNDYNRNKVRNLIMPLLEDINPAAQENIHNVTNKVYEAQLIIEEEVEQIRELLTTKKDELWIPIDLIIHHLAPTTMLYELLKPFGFTGDQVIQILDHAHRQSGRYFYSDTHKLSQDRSDWILSTKTKNGIPKRKFDDLEALLNATEIKVELVEKPAFKLSRNPAVGQLDADKLHFPIIFRKWNEGDKFVPLGMKTSKKLSDFFIDEKIPNHVKDQVTIVEANGEIAWIAGYRISELFKVDEQTKSVVVLKQDD